MSLKMDMVLLAFNAIKDRVLSTILSTEPSDSQFKTGNYRILVETKQVLYRPNTEEEYRPFEAFFKNDQVTTKGIVELTSSLADRHADLVKVVGVQFNLKNELNLRPTISYDAANDEIAALLKNDFAVSCSTGSIDFSFNMLVEEKLDDKLITLIEGLTIAAVAKCLHYSDTDLKPGTYRCDLNGDVKWSWGPEWYKAFPAGDPEAFRNTPVGITPPSVGHRVGIEILNVLKSYIDLDCNKLVMGIEFCIGNSPEQYQHSYQRRQGPMISAVLMLANEKEM